MKVMKNAIKKFVAGVGLMCSMFAGAVGFDEVQSANADKFLVGDDVVLVFTNTEETGTFTIPSNAKARVLTVAGGGAGGSMAAVDEIGHGSAGGGGAGGVSDHETILDGGTYMVQVGRGGQKVQTIVQAWVGANGENSTVMFTNAPIFTAKGGGGGGTVKINGNAEDGASGGGGSWFNGFTKAGGHVDGQGWNGAVSDDENVGGGGGGGANINPILGSGKADGVGGAGRILDITGEEIEYGRGGSGGARDRTGPPSDGIGFGFGGGGANSTGRGGKGGDGVVVVRIHKLFTYTQVEAPAQVSYDWIDGQNIVALNLDQLAEPLRSAIDYVDGTTNVVCGMDGTNIVGVGRYCYVLHLKDEYEWADHTIAPKTIYWRVKETGTVGEATIDVTKTVSWSSGRDAVISIDIHTTPEKIENTPNVLFLSSLCSAHGFSTDVFKSAVNAVTEVANIDYYAFNTTSSKTPTADFEGHLSKGQRISTLPAMKSGNHGSMYGFYEYLAKAIDSGKRYDYIIFSFDRALTATSFTSGSHSREQDVVNFLKPYYESGSVIWLVDNKPENDTAHGIAQTPWYPSQLVCITVNNTSSWNSLYYYYYQYVNTSGNNRANTARTNSRNAWRALMGLFSPDKYASATDTLYNNNYQFNDSNNVRTQVVNLSGTVNPNQVIYDNAENVSSTIKALVKVKPSTVEMKDNVCVSMGLDVKESETKGKWTTNETAIGWIPLTSDNLVFTDSGVELKLPGIVDPCEIKIDIAVEDTGAFRTSQNATYNERTGLWEKDPNDGPASVKIKPDGGPDILDQAEAATAVAWSFPTYQITGEVVDGEGELVLNGFVIESIGVAAGTSPEVVFRGKGGYVLDYLEIDGQEIKDFDKDCYSWQFLDVAADHDIKVGFKSVFTTPYPDTTPRTEVYDGTPYGPYCSEPSFLEGYDYEWYPVYSTDPDGEFSPTGGVKNVVYDENGNPMPQTVYTKIMIMQPGYENGVILDDWMGESTVTILPRPITVKFDDYAQTSGQEKESGFSWEIVSGMLVDGDEIVPNDGKCTSYPTKGNKTEDSIVPNGEMTVTTPDCDINNYAITVIPGDYYYPNHEVVANANSIVKTYDGKATNMTVTVLSPAKTPTVDDIKKEYTGNQYNYIQNIKENEVIEYSIDGGKTWTRTIPDFIDVGEYEITYRVSYSYTFEHRYSWYNTWTSQTVTYTPYEGTATITILPRDVVVTAPSAEKTYDGSPLTAPDVTVTGFVDGEGFSKIGVTADSTITNPGSTANRIDKDHTVVKPNTDLSNYNIKYVDGKLTVLPNPITATATSVKKVYDGTPAGQIVVTPTFTNGTAFTEGTIYYRTTPDGEWTTIPPTPPTDAGEYPIYYKVDGGGYGTIEGVTTITVTPRTVKLRAGSSEKTYDGRPLTDDSFEVVQTVGKDSGFIDGEGISAVTMTEDSTQTEVGAHSNTINVYDTENWTMTSGTKIQNYVFEVLPGTLKVIGGPALMIVDHASPVDGFVDLTVKVQYQGENKFRDWYHATNFAAKAGSTVSEMEKTKPVSVEVVDILIDDNLVTIRIPFDQTATTYFIRVYAYGKGAAWKHSNGVNALDFTTEDGVMSINIHAMLKIDSATTNTMIAIPWTWYSEKPEDAEPIWTRKLVNTQALTDGDTLLQFTGTGVYNALYMYGRDWEAIDTVKVDEAGVPQFVTRIADPKQDSGEMRLDAYDKLTIDRGRALWLSRRTPGQSFWLYGQYVDTDVTTDILPPPETVTGNKSKDVTSNAIGNPFNREIKINDLVFDGEINSDDRIWVPNGTVTAPYLVYMKGCWRYATIDPDTRRTKYVTDIPVAPGRGFWYDRRGNGPMKIRWPR